MFTRTPSLGSVSYKGQRALILAALTASKSQVPEPFNLNHVVEAIDPVAYEKTFKHGKQVVTIPESVYFHLKELVKVGQLERIAGERETEVVQIEATGVTSPYPEPDSLLTEWEQWEPGAPPFTFDADRESLASTKSSKALLTLASWAEVIAAPDFGRPSDKQLHLGLLPQPFIGDLRRASIYVLSLNPGLDPTDYYGEYEVPEYRAALMNTLKQQLQDALPFIFLDPRYSWHAGYRYWHRKLVKVISTLADESGVSFASVRATLATELASIEILPYHSSEFHDAGGWLNKLKSVTLARNFVRQFVLPRVKRGEAIAIVLRKVALWGLPEIPGVILYEGKDARGAHLDPGSAGGRAILARLREKRAFPIDSDAV